MPGRAERAPRQHRTVALTAGITASSMLLAVAAAPAVAAPAGTDTGSRVQVRACVPPTQTEDTYAGVLSGIGAPISSVNLAVMRAWARAEGSCASFNPWNTTQNAPGSYKDSAGTTWFADLPSAVAAVTRQLLSLYKGIVAGFVASDANATIAALVESPWASGNYYGKGNYQNSTIWRIYLEAPGDGSSAPAPPASPTVVVAPKSIRSPRVSAGKRYATLRWSAPNNGGSKIIRYQVAIRHRNAVAHRWGPWTLGELPRSTRHKTWSKLDKRQKYQLVVRAGNKAGYGPWSARISVTAG